MEPTILTRSGKYFNFTAPTPESIDIEDIAHALAHLCRFTGHTQFFYSVAQHSVLVSHLVPQHLALAGLLHDAHEAYVGDVSSPLKGILPGYKALERQIEAAVRLRFALPDVLPPAVKHADLVALRTEQRDCMFNRDPWTSMAGIEPHEDSIHWMPPALARESFLRRYRELTS